MWLLCMHTHNIYMHTHSHTCNTHAHTFAHTLSRMHTHVHTYIYMYPRIVSESTWCSLVIFSWGKQPWDRDRQSRNKVHMSISYSTRTFSTTTPCWPFNINLWSFWSQSKGNASLIHEEQGLGTCSSSTGFIQLCCFWNKGSLLYKRDVKSMCISSCLEVLVVKFLSWKWNSSARYSVLWTAQLD